MQLLLEIEDNRASFVLELLGQLKGVNATPIVNQEVQLLKAEIQEAVANLNLIKQGKMKSKSLNALLDGL
jgi:hypothetical protein